MLGVVNGSILLLVAAWFAAMTLLCITESPTHDEVRD